MSKSKSQVESNVTNTSRRKFMKGVTTGVIGVSAIGASNNVSADIPWTSLSGAGLAFESSAIALDYILGDGYVDEAQNRAANYIHMRYGDMRNYDGYTGADALITEVGTGLKEMQLASEQIMTGIENQIQMSDNVGYSKGKVALIESLNGGNDVTTAKSDMNTVLNTYYTKIQTNIIEHWNTQFEQLTHMGGRVSAHSNLNLGDYFYAAIDTDDSAATPAENQYFRDWTAVDYIDGEGSSSVSYTVRAEQQTLEYLNGDTEQVWTGYPTDWNPGGTTTMLTPVSPSNQSAISGASIVSQGLAFTGNGTPDTPNVQIDSPKVTAVVLNGRRYWAAYQKLKTARDRVNADLQGFADDLYNNYQSGDLSLSEIVDPITYATEMATDVDNDAFRQASAAQLGFSTNATENVTIQINDGESEPVIETDLYTSHSPSSGNWEVGTQYDPSNWSEPLFITYPDDDGTVSMAQLETPFTIQDAIDKDGNSVDTFQNRETNTQTADIASIQEELEKLRETQLELQQDSGTNNTDTPQDSDGGSGGSSTNIVDELTTKYFGFPLYGWIAGGGVITYVGTKVENE